MRDACTRACVSALVLVGVVLLSACASQPPEQAGAEAVAQAGSTQPATPATSDANASAPGDVLTQLAEGVVLPRESNGATARVGPVAQPTAESSAIERGSTAALGAVGGSAQARHDGTPSLSSLPAVSSEVPRARIGWYVNRSIDAFRSAIDQNKPLVLVVSVDWCEYCTRLVYHVLRCPATERFAGDAVFAYSYVASDKGAFAIANSLEIDAYPTITVLEPEARMLLERGRINGYFEAGLIGTHLDTILWKTAPRVLGPDFALNATAGSPGQRSILGTWPTTPSKPTGPATERDALAESQRRGLRHASPTPQCR